MNDILIATILPNGIDRASGNYLFSLCLDVNPNVNPESYTDEQLLDMTQLLLKAIDKWADQGFDIQVKGNDHKVTGAAIMHTGKKADAAAIRKEIWKRLFDYRPAAIPFGAADLPLMKNAVLASADLIGKPLLGGPLQQLRRSIVRETVTDVLKKADDLKKVYGKEVDTLFEKIKGIRAYSELKSEDQSKAYFERKISAMVAPGAAAAAALDSRNFISKEKIFDTLSLLSESSIYQRLSGFVIDFKLELAIGDAEFAIKFKAPADIEGVKAADWITPSSAMVVYKTDVDGRTKKLVLLEGKSKMCSGIYSSSELEVVNHDKLAKIDSLQQVFAEIDALGNGQRTREQDEQLIAAIKQIDTSTITKGFNVYHGQWGDQVDAGGIVNNKEEKELSSGMLLKEQNFIKGQRFGVAQKNGQFVSLGRRRCNISWKKGNNMVDLLDDPIEMDFSVNTDTGMASLDEATGKISTLVDETLVAWSGENLAFPTVFAKKEDEENMESTNDEGGISDSMQVSMERLRRVFDEQQFPFNTSIRKATVRFEGGRVRYASLAEEASLVKLTYTPIPKSNPRLIFGEAYELIIVHEYKNGWAIPFADSNPYQMNVSEYVQLTKRDCNFPTPTFTFRRNEPVHPVAVFLREQLFNNAGTEQLAGREGESLHHLVIRNQNGGNTVQSSSRHLLPPQISFQHAFWHGKIFEMSSAESFRWYQKYMSDEGIRMPRNIPNGTAYPNYLPDPLCRGFRMRFFLDKELKYAAPGYTDRNRDYVEFLFNNANYPAVPSCLLTIEDHREGLSKISKDDGSITVRVSKGEELFAEIRTMMFPAYEDQLEVFGGKSTSIENGNNNYITPPLTIRISHAVKTPLINPEFDNSYAIERPKNTSFIKFDADVHFEQLNLFKDKDGKYKYMDNSMPTGDMELYAKWEDYIDDPDQVMSEHHRKDWTPEEPVIPLKDIEEYVLQTPINIGAQVKNMSANLSTKDDNPDLNPAKNYVARINFYYDLRSTKYHERYFVIKNKSSFTAYYPSDTGAKDFEKSSTNAHKLIVLNNKKPAKPSVNRIIPLLVTDEQNSDDITTRTSHGKRFRIYLNRGRLTSGKDERLGVLVYETRSPYNRYFEETDQLSITGRDITGDAFRPVVDNDINKRIFLYPANIGSEDPSGLTFPDGTRASDLSKFRQEYVKELGCWTFLPKFNRQENLWYVDIEVDIDGPNSNSLHTPFFQLGLVHYQKYSVHNAGTLADDYRISEVEKSPFLYLLPERKVSIRQPNNNSVRIGLTVDKESLLATASSRKSIFIGAVQYSDDDVIWQTAPARQAGREAFSKLDVSPVNETEISFERRNGYNYRMLVLELEAFDTALVDAATKFNDIVEARSNRVIMVNTFAL